MICLFNFLLDIWLHVLPYRGFFLRGIKICEFCDCKFIRKNTLLTAFKFFVVTDNWCFMQYVDVKIYTRRAVFSKEHITNGRFVAARVQK